MKVGNQLAGLHGNSAYDEALYCFKETYFCPRVTIFWPKDHGKAYEAGVKGTKRNKLHEEGRSVWAARSLGLTIALASASVLPVSLVAVVSAVCPLLRGGQ